MPLTGPHNANLARVLLNHVHTGHHTSNVRPTPCVKRKKNSLNVGCLEVNELLLSSVCGQFWIRVPLMATEDMREDLIENEPTSCIDDTSVDEKTWSWWVSHFPSTRVLSACWNGCHWFPLKSWFSLFTCLWSFRWHSFRTLCDYNKRICLGERAHGVAAASGKVIVLRNNYDHVCYWKCTFVLFLQLLKSEQTCRQKPW